MENCFYDYTVVNSQPSLEALENLIQEFSWTFGLTETIDDMFFYGVFFKPQDYVNFKFNENEIDFELPYALSSPCANQREKIDYVKSIMNQIMKKEIKKPEWMKYIEMNMVCNAYGQAPSSFLNIIPKEEKYQKLAERLLEFLYSPNLTITMCKA